MTVKLILRKVPNEPEKSYLFIRTTVNRKSKFKSLGIKIDSANLKKSGDGVKSTEPNAKEINESIKKELSQISEGGGLEAVNNRESKKHRVVAFMDRIIENTANQGTLKSRRAARNKFQGYLETLGKDDITFAELTPDLLDGFYAWLLRNNYKKNTANNYLQTLQLFVNYAKRDEKVNLPVDFNPFVRFKFKRNPVKNKALSKEELKIFANAKWEKESYRSYRDMFMFQLYGGGLRVSDVLMLTWRNIYVDEGDIVLDYISYKTKKPMVASLFVNALEFLNTSINRYNPEFLKKIQELEARKAKAERSAALTDKDIAQLESVDLKPLEVLKSVQLFKRDNLEEQIQYFTYLESLREHRKALDEELKSIYLETMNHYREEISKLNISHSEEFIFPFFWDEAKNKPAIALNSELMTEKDYKKLTNERSKYDNILKRMRKLLGIKTPISTHAARHSFTQLLMESNVNTHYISMSLGHSSIATTELYRRTLQNKDSMRINDRLPSFRE